MKGYIKFFDSTRGYGFVVSDEDKTETFFHFSGTLDKVVSADNVEYNIVEGKRGPIAVDIKRVRNGKN